MEVDEMLKSREIKPAETEWAASILLDPKKDGPLQFGVYYRKVHSVTVRNSYQLQEWMSGATSYATLWYFPRLTEVATIGKSRSTTLIATNWLSLWIMDVQIFMNAICIV